MPPASGVAVRGFRELSAAHARAEKKVKAGFTEKARALGEPVRRDAETLARERIPRIGSAWAEMRTGVTQKSVYVAPKRRGIKSRDSRLRRPKFGTLLMDRAMQPALDRNAPGIERAFEGFLDEVGREWERG